MSSPLESDLGASKHFHSFTEWGEVLRKQCIPTRRLGNGREARRAAAR